MHSHTIERWRHDHSFLGATHERNERRTTLVVALTALMMLVEIVGGTVFNSMALVADGWHMSTHVLALGIAALAYRYARLHSGDPRFSFGTGKLGELAGFASAIILGMIALFICYESIGRLLTPAPIAFGEAIPIASLGLLVNIASAALLHGSGHDDGHSHGPAHHHHGHDDHHPHDHHGAGDDTNMRAAYVHVLADALTSALAIAALVAGWALGWSWLDPLVGLFGSAVIVAWTISLVRSAGAVLLDLVPSQQVAQSVRAAIEMDGDMIADLHLWRLGPGHAGAILSVVTDHARTPADYKRRLAGIDGLSHVTVEVNPCECGHAA